MQTAQTADLLMAVDGGQSSTLALVATPSGTILGVGWGGPSNHIHEPGGVERLQSALRDSIASALRGAGCEPGRVQHICLGLSGVSPLAGDIAQALLPSAQILLHHDAVTALAGAAVGQPGVIVIAGTGAVAYGQLADGRSARSGGWGYIMGDEGSAYDIGCGALRAASQASDGRGPATRLLEDIPQHLHLADLHAVHRGVYSHQITRVQIAGLASIVGLAAQNGDFIAQELLHGAGQQLAISALAVLERLERLDSGMAVYVTGGVFRSGDYVLSSFRETLKERSPRSTASEAAFSPIIGALFLALKAAAVSLDDQVLKSVRVSAPQVAISKHFGQNT